ncbi:MAG: polysaccharide deacetylase family protein [Motiliproteus sp.]
MARNALLLIAMMLMTLGCAIYRSPPASPEADELLVMDNDFIIIRSRPGDRYEAIAKRFFGSADAHDRLRALNPKLNPAGGTLVAIPARAHNLAAVDDRGYRTIPILCYHQFTPNAKARHQLDLTASGFRAQLQYLHDQGYQVLRLADLEKFLSGQRQIPRKSVILTIDDGYRSFYEVAFPILKEFGYPATLFVYTDFIGGNAALTWNQMLAMQATGLVDIQSHGKSHSSLADPKDDPVAYRRWVKEELTKPAVILKKKLGHQTDLFSYPYGATSDTAINLLKQQGVRLAATVEQGGNPSFADPLRLKRTMIYATDDLDRFSRKLAIFKKTRF